MRTLALLLLLGLGLALEAPEAVEAQPGGFLSVPVRGEGRIQAAEVPRGLIPLTEGVEGEGVLNFLVGLEALAGEHTLVLKDARETRIVRVRIPVRAGVELRVPPGAEGVEGESLSYTLSVRNSGNAQDRVRLEVRSLLPYRLSQEVLELAPGEAKEVTLEVRLVGRNRDTATVFAYSGLDPKVRAYGVLETVIQPFAGAEKLSRQALYYRFGLTGRYGQGALAYNVALSLSGALSDYVRLASSLALKPEGPVGELAFFGEGFALDFRGYPGVYRLDGEFGPFQGYAAWAGGGLSVGGTYQEGPWRVSGHAGGLGQRFSLGYAWKEGGLTLVPYGVASRQADPEAVRAGVGLEGGWEHRDFSLSGRAEYLDGFRLRLTGATRSQEPWGLKGEVAYERGKLQGSATLSARLDEATTQNLSLRLADNLGLLYTLAYRPPGQPFSLSGTLGAQGGLVVGLSGRYREGGVEVGGTLGRNPQGPHFSLYATYRERDYALQGGYTALPSGRQIQLAAQGALPPWEGTLSLGYNLDQKRPEARFGLAYREGGLVLGLEGAYAEGVLRLSALGGLETKGGFDTPEALVQAFGGRATGYVEGVVFHDRNRDGVKGIEEPPLPGAKVQVGSLEAVADGEGRYRLELYPGTYRLEVGGLEASLALRRRAEVRVERGRTLSLDLPVETVVGFMGQVYLDENRNGQKDEGEVPLPYVRVRLQGAETRTALADGRGVFVMGGLLPGSYTLSLDPASLDKLQEPGEPVALDLKPGPLPQVLLAARPVVREIVRTLTEESLAVVLGPLPAVLPPGAELPLRVQVQGGPSRVWAELGGRTYPLSPLEKGLYGAYLPVEDPGSLELKVVAERGAERAEAGAYLTVRPGPLATLLVTPALLDPGEEVRLEARLLRRANRVEVRLGPLIVPLDRVDDLTFRGTLLAPKTPGSYELELYLDGTRATTARIRVRD
ncbi:hypothetical protein [Thermus amyloliquefaciens]|uniref:hypothetical protein n=1 Tax=Thermus amyloliquefaciens TaxID=1449080 RepID=UPI00056EB843|nr:hypothetical protein [Thermus amyloliquefaciens]